MTTENTNKSEMVESNASVIAAGESKAKEIILLIFFILLAVLGIAIPASKSKTDLPPQDQTVVPSEVSVNNNSSDVGTKAEDSGNSYENLATEDLRKLSNKLSSDLDNAINPVAALDKKMIDLKPSLNGGSEEQSIQVAENIVGLASQARDKFVAQGKILEKIILVLSEMAHRGEFSEKDLTERQKSLKAELTSANDQVKQRNDDIEGMRSALSEMVASHNTNIGRMSESKRFAIEQQHMQTEASLKSINEQLESLPSYATANRKLMERERAEYQVESNFEKSQLENR